MYALSMASLWWSGMERFTKRRNTSSPFRPNRQPAGAGSLVLVFHHRSLVAASASWRRSWPRDALCNVAWGCRAAGCYLNYLALTKCVKLKSSAACCQLWPNGQSILTDVPRLLHPLTLYSAVCSQFELMGSKSAIHISLFTSML